MFDWLRKRFSPTSTAVTPQFDADIERRLAQEGKQASALVADAAAPLEIPPKPLLPGVAGMISFEMTLDAEGRVTAVQMSGAPFNHVTELEAWAHAWTFQPARLEGKPHACRMTFEVHWS